MLPYLFVFAISIFSTYLAQICYNRNNKFLFVLFSAAAILTPALLAGFRDSGIGTDTEIYVDDIWNQFKHINSWGQFYKYYKNEEFQDIEFVYLALNYIVSQFGENLGYIYFASNFVVVFFVYLTAFDNRNKASMWLIMTLFLFMYYNSSLNLVRQSIALVFCLYSFKYFERRQWIKAIIWTIIILQSHNTGVFYLLLIGIYFLFQIKNKYIRNILLVINVFAIAVLFSVSDLFLVLLVSNGILPSKFLYYLASESDSDELTKSILINYIYFAGVLFFTYTKYHKRDQPKKELIFYSYSKIIGAVLFMTSLISKWAYRISFYVNYPVDIVFFPRSLQLLKQKSKIHYTIVLTLSLILILITWYWTIILNNGNETYPYKSKILGI